MGFNCEVCKKPLFGTEKVVALNCGHCFHDACCPEGENCKTCAKEVTSRVQIFLGKEEEEAPEDAISSRQTQLKEIETEISTISDRYGAAKAKHDTEKARFDAQKAIVDSLEEELKGLTKTTTDLKADVKKNEVELTEITERFSDIEKDKEFHARVTVAIGNHMNRCADAGILKTVNKAIELVDRMKESPDLQS
ncbi:hypothetical protein ADUPG1_011532, partial [Aduncisulcus paluster]